MKKTALAAALSFAPELDYFFDPADLLCYASGDTLLLDNRTYAKM